MYGIYKPSTSEASGDDIWSDDTLGRKEIAIFLSEVLQSTQDSVVINLDAPYGSGKSFFLERLSKQLRMDGFPTLLFNSWQTDHASDPFIAFVSTVAPQLKDDAEHTFRDKIRNFTAISGKLALRHVVPGVTKALTMGLINTTELFHDAKLEAVADDVTKAAITDISSPILKHFTETQQNIEGFQNALISAHEILTKNTLHKTVVMIIDELDRCRPDYAINLLEILKHFFAVKGFVFVLATNKAQLSCAVKAVYGSEFNGGDYLSRFFDYELRLPEANYYNFSLLLLTRSHNNIILKDKQLTIDIATVWAKVCQTQNISARDQQRLFSVFDLASRVANVHPHFFPAMAATLIVDFRGGLPEGDGIDLDKWVKCIFGINQIVSDDKEIHIMALVFMAHIRFDNMDARLFHWDLVKERHIDEMSGIRQAASMALKMYKEVSKHDSILLRRPIVDILRQTIQRARTFADMDRSEELDGGADDLPEK